MIKPEQPEHRVRTRRHQPRRAGLRGHGEDRRLLLGRARHAAGQVARPARRHGPALLLRRGQRRLRRLLLVRRGSRRRAGRDSRPRRSPASARSSARWGRSTTSPSTCPAEKFDEYRQRLKDKGFGSGPCSTTTRARRRSRRHCTPASTCGRSTSWTRTESRSSSLAGPRNSPPMTPRRCRGRRPTGGHRSPPEGLVAVQLGSASSSRIARQLLDQFVGLSRSMSPASHALIVWPTPPTTKCAMRLECARSSGRRNALRDVLAGQQSRSSAADSARLRATTGVGQRGAEQQPADAASSAIVADDVGHARPVLLVAAGRRRRRPGWWRRCRRSPRRTPRRRTGPCR